MQAVILAAGEGKRIRPLTRGRPKALIPVANRPIIDYPIQALLDCGIRNIVVVVGYRKEQVIRYLNTLDVPVDVVVQEKQLGTAHALKCAEDVLEDEFLVLPGDNYIDSPSLRKVAEQPNSMLVKTHPYPSNFGVVVIKEGYVESIVEKPEHAPSFTISTGILSLTKEFFKYARGNDITDAITEMLYAGIRIRPIMAGNWQDAIYPWDLLSMNARLIDSISPQKAGIIEKEVVIQGNVQVGKGSRIGPHTVIQGPVIIGEECEIASHCCIGPYTSIGSRVSVEPFTYIDDSILMDDAAVGAHSRVMKSVLGQGVTLGDHSSIISASHLMEIESYPIKGNFGAIFGDEVRSGPFTVFEGAIVGNNVTIIGGKKISSTSAYKDGITVI
ncbi:MAG TPA: bifunctional sugar-1-phosphate nucleotidylyltransferase/acetyltransferase [Methanoregulaceae archaeon]|nr:bifunctional sugar-1-phosphate nucleotidylyltransferase/acetyltransferase [Methanoregulaceae archaeon]